jgi:hypothetical protein
MRLDAASWPKVLALLPPTEAEVTESLAVAFVDAEDYATKSGSAWLWWPDGRRAAAKADFDGRFPPEWGMFLVMSEAAVEAVCAEGAAAMAGLVRRLQIKPFLLQQRDALEAAGILDFIESLELATPKH